jgi:SAM-dependent methyltransferase
MHKKFLDFFHDPADKGSLNYFEIETSGSNLLNGVFINSSTGACYPLMNGVPVFLPGAFPADWIKRNFAKMDEFKSKFSNASVQSFNAGTEWSFSSEWEVHTEKGMTTTWGFTVQSRFEQFLLEVETTKEEIQGKTLLDAGCGNGMLTEYFASEGMISFGIDFSNSVFAAEAKRKSENVCFLRGDLQQPPFADNFFDYIVSNGVIHHTRNTEQTFNKLAATVKKGGRFFIWLYERKGSIMWRMKRRIFDFFRSIVSRLPPSVQKIIVRFFTQIIFSAYKMAGKKLDYETLHVDMFDSITPRWRHYHTPEEVSRWYFESGFGAIRITHWNNKYGFGVYALKNPLTKTPGSSYAIS